MGFIWAVETSFIFQLLTVWYEICANHKGVLSVLVLYEKNKVRLGSVVYML